VRLPEHIDLSEPADSAYYARAAVRVTGKAPGEVIEFRGEAIVNALSIPAAAPHAPAAARFVAFLLSPTGKRILRTAQLDVLEHPVVIGTGAPSTILHRQP
jgi:molybdate/tungstate transport system substrate-binding protein